MLPSLEEYELFLYSLTERFPLVESSTLVLVRVGRVTAYVKGEVRFPGNICLKVVEALDFQDGLIRDYSYEVRRGEERLWWYDPQPHPDDSTLARTHPHHKHIPPEIKHNRIPAPCLSFEEPNLPFLIEEIERELLHS